MVNGSGRDNETERVRGVYDRLARRYDGAIRLPERLLFTGGRAWVCSQAIGDVLEVGAGTGRNLAWYPPGVRLTGIDISPGMLDIARQRRDAAGLDADLRVGDAQRMEFSDHCFDTVLATLSLCSIPDDAAAVTEMARVLRPGGRLLLLEHVASPRPIVRGGQRLMEPLFVRLQGDHLLRRPEEQVAAAGLCVDQLLRSAWGITVRLAAHKALA